MRSSAGSAAVCFSDSINVARSYCNHMDGTEEIARLAKARDRAFFDYDSASRESELADAKERYREAVAAWRDAGYPREARIYKASISPAYPAFFDAQGRHHRNMNGARDRRDMLSIFNLARLSRDAGHDCLIVSNVLDGGTLDIEGSSMTVMVFDTAILSPPELVEHVAFRTIDGSMTRTVLNPVLVASPRP